MAARSYRSVCIATTTQPEQFGVPSLRTFSTHRAAAAAARTHGSIRLVHEIDRDLPYGLRGLSALRERVPGAPFALLGSVESITPLGASPWWNSPRIMLFPTSK